MHVNRTPYGLTPTQGANSAGTTLTRLHSARAESVNEGGISLLPIAAYSALGHPPTECSIVAKAAPSLTGPSSRATTTPTSLAALTAPRLIFAQQCSVLSGRRQNSRHRSGSQSLRPSVVHLGELFFQGSNVLGGEVDWSSILGSEDCDLPASQEFEAAYQVIQLPSVHRGLRLATSRYRHGYRVARCDSVTLADFAAITMAPATASRLRLVLLSTSQD